MTWPTTVSIAFAAARSVSPTTRGVEATTAGRYTALSELATNATTAPTSTGPSNITTKISGTMSSPRPISRPTMRRRRSSRSASTPPGAPKSTNGRMRSTNTSETHAVEPVCCTTQTVSAIE